MGQYLLSVIRNPWFQLLFLGLIPINSQASTNSVLRPCPRSEKSKMRTFHHDFGRCHHLRQVLVHKPSIPHAWLLSRFRWWLVMPLKRAVGGWSAQSGWGLRSAGSLSALDHAAHDASGVCCSIVRRADENANGSARCAQLQFQPRV